MNQLVGWNLRRSGYQSNSERVIGEWLLLDVHYAVVIGRVANHQGLLDGAVRSELHEH